MSSIQRQITGLPYEGGFYLATFAPLAGQLREVPLEAQAQSIFVMARAQGEAFGKMLQGSAKDQVEDFVTDRRSHWVSQSLKLGMAGINPMSVFATNAWAYYQGLGAGLAKGDAASPES